MWHGQGNDVNIGSCAELVRSESSTVRQPARKAASDRGTVSQTKTSAGSYHHGDLANALTKTATELARHGGPDAVVLREAARRIGVSATSAYRYFESRADLIRAVAELARAELAERMVREVAAHRPPAEPAEPAAAALLTLRGLGLGYLHFALEEPGLFRTAFGTGQIEDPDLPPDLSSSQAFRMLGQALDELVACGRIPAARRPMMDLAVWAAVHGMATLLLDGPLSRLPIEARPALVESILTLIEYGLQPPPVPQT